MLDMLLAESENEIIRISILRRNPNTSRDMATGIEMMLPFKHDSNYKLLNDPCHVQIQKETLAVMTWL